MKLFSLFSGGKDSVTLADYLAKRRELDSAVFFDTGISTPDALLHVENTCRKFDWNLIIYPTPVRYEWFVLKYGFPTGAAHNWIMGYLKGRCVRAFRKEFPDRELASGVRKDESHRRFVNTKEVGEWENVTIHAPLYDWSSEAVWDYVKENSLPLSPAYSKLHYSADCLCGAMSHPYELKIIQMFYPEVFKRIADLEQRCRRLGIGRCKWGGIGTEATAQQSLLCFECAMR